MSKKLKVDTERRAQETVLRLIGDIDEDADFQSLDLQPSAAYTFDFQGICLINSCGIREWINFMRRFDQGTTLTYERCPQILVEQMNVVRDFFHCGADVRSFYAPCYCEKCDQETQVLLESKDIRLKLQPELVCEKCHSPMVFDIDEDLYFRFLKAG